MRYISDYSLDVCTVIYTTLRPCVDNFVLYRVAQKSLDTLLETVRYTPSAVRLVRRPVYDASDMHYVPRPQENHVTCVWQFCNSEMANVCIRWTQMFHSVAVLTLPLSFV